MKTLGENVTSGPGARSRARSQSSASEGPPPSAKASASLAVSGVSSGGEPPLREGCDTAGS